MKNPLLIFSIVILNSYSYAQYDTFRIIPAASTTFSNEILDSSYYWRWNDSTAQFDMNQRGMFRYNSNQEYSNISYCDWNGTQWDSSSNYTYQYDLSGNLIEWITQIWDSVIWKNSFRYYYEYDSSANKTKWLLQNWNGVWENVHQILYSYDINNNQVQDVSQIWNGIAWDNSGMNTYTYDINNNLITSLMSNWNGQWDSINLKTNTYDINNDLASTLDQSYSNGNFVNHFLFINSYDTYHNNLTQLQQRWINNAWENISHSTRDFDSLNNSIHGVAQDWNGTAWENAMQEWRTYSFSNLLSLKNESWNNQWVNSDSTHFYYSHVDGIPELSDIQFSVFPNPSFEKITVNSLSTIKKAEIFDACFRLRSSSIISKGVKSIDIPVSSLSPGIYFIRLNGNSSAIKFIKE
jgi:YD repeat-containing protein